jgi:hypothetical protein
MNKIYDLKNFILLSLIKSFYPAYFNSYNDQQIYIIY